MPIMIRRVPKVEIPPLFGIQDDEENAKGTPKFKAVSLFFS